MNDERELLRRTAELAADFLDTLDERPVFPLMPVEDLGAQLAVPLPDAPTDPLEVVETLARELDSGLVASAGRTVLRIRHRRSAARSAGGGLADLGVGSEHRPLRRRACGLLAEQVAGMWVKEILGLPGNASFAFVTGCQMAHVTCLAAARHDVLARVGWDVVERRACGMPRGSPSSPARCAMSQSIAHFDCSGWGPRSVVEVAADDQGRMRADALADDARLVARPADRVCAGRRGEHRARSTRCSRSSSSRTGPEPGSTSTARSGLWAAASPTLRGLVEGVGARGLMGIRRPQVAQRPLRLWRCSLCTSGRAPCCDGHHGVLPARDGRRSQHRRLDTGGIAPPAGLDGIRRLEISRAHRG